MTSRGNRASASNKSAIAESAFPMAKHLVRPAGVDFFLEVFFRTFRVGGEFLFGDRKCRSRIHDQMAVSVAVAVDCALRLRTFAQKFLT